MYHDIVVALSESGAIGRDNKVFKRKRSVVGWNKHVSGAHMEARRTFLTWVWCGKPAAGQIYEEMCDSRRKFKSRLKWCQNNENQIKMDMLASHHSKNDFKSFWKATNRLNKRPGLPVCIDGESDSKEIANIFMNHFSVKSPLGPSSWVLDVRSGMELETRFSAKDIEKTISSMSRGKSPGHDGLSIEHLRYAGPHLPRTLSMLFALCMSHAYLPVEMLGTLVVPVVKNKTGDLADKNNYRPISLATIISKIFDGLLNTQLNKCVKLHDNQFGFRPGLSTDSAILCLKQTVKYYTDRKTSVYAGFLDLSKAFDLVSYEMLWKKLDDAKLPKELINIVKFWYGSQVNSVRWAGVVSDAYGLECGVRQGGLTSPTLFNLYVKELIEELSSTRVGCYVDGVCLNNISYADDMVLLSASPCGLSKLLGICERYALQHGLVYNVKKSEVMVFEAGSSCVPIEMPIIKLNDVPLQRVNKFKYLGHILTADLRDDNDIERERRALSVRANMIARRFARCSSEVKVVLFRAYCTSFYTCSLWAHFTLKAYSALRVQYNNAFRVLMGLPRFCSASGMFAEARVDCFYTVMRKRCASLVRRVRGSTNSILNMIAGRLDCAIVNRCCKISAGPAG